MQSLTYDEKLRLVEEAEQDPGITIDKLKENAKKVGEEVRLIIWLPPNINEALGIAAKDVRLSKSEIGKDAIKEWLDRKGYLE